MGLAACQPPEAEKAAAPAASGAAPAAASAAPAAANADGSYNVAVNDAACEPMELTVPSGETVFHIKNNSGRKLEWEILEGVMVVDERENIAPGLSDKMTVTLLPGTYEMTCGLLTNPRGEAKQLVEKTEKFVAAVKAGKVDEAKALFADTRVHYERIEPIAELFNELDPAIDSREDDYKEKAKDDAFTGFHRIEHALWIDGKIDDKVKATADKLDKDVKTLKAEIDVLSFPPGKVVGGAADLIEEVAGTKITGEEDRYSHTDLSDFQANIDGSKKIVDLFRPAIAEKNQALLDTVDDNFKKINDILAKYKKGDGFEPYDKLSEEDRKQLKAPINTLAEELGKLRGVLGLK